jgi:stage II sporulation protein D
VRLAEKVKDVRLKSTQAAVYRAAGQTSSKRLALPDGGIAVRLQSGYWHIGNVRLGPGELIVQPAEIGSVSVNGRAYRGQFRFVPVSPDAFDVINDVSVEGYLKSVLPRELLSGWNPETYKAQAIAARTYVLYECHTAGVGRYWDVFDDQRSQVYGGLADETTKSRQAVDETAGIVLAYGPPGHERIFKAYFSSCCGGVSQSVTDAFPTDTYIPPLSDRNNGSLCNASPRYNWGPVVISKAELTRRFRLFGARRNGPERNMGNVTRLEIEAINRFGRPVRFRVYDDRGNRYSWSGEEVRWAVNTDAPAGSRLFSSFFKIIDAPDAVHFVDGHGLGHGVGMCQWCAEAMAEAGMRHEDIVLSSYPKAVLVRAY